MKRGEIWTLKDTHYASKARPVVIIQANPEGIFDSVILCLFTTFESNNISTRIRIKPTAKNGLTKTSYVMTEKIITVEKALLGQQIGILSKGEMHLIAGKLAKILEIHKDDIED
jgi:mRNA interferase MazF